MTIIKGESLSIAIVINNYDKTRIVEKRLYIGSVWYPLVEEDNMLVCRLTSQQTDSRGIGRHHISLWLDDTILGVRKPELGDIIVMPTGALKNTESESSIYNLIYTLDILDDEITVDDVLYNYVKGDKGDPFLYSDFTPEQIAELQQPATDAIASIEAVELAVETAEGLRVQAEINRQTNTSTAISNAEQATDDANDAALLANEKAGLSNNAAILANEKAGLAATATTQANDARDGANSAAQSATNLVNSYATELAAKELKANKQNSLEPDGTGTKFPTVDAVNTEFDTKPTIFEAYGNLSAGIETTIAGTSFNPVLNLRPINIQVFSEGVLKIVTAKYVVNGDNYDLKLTSSVALIDAEITVLGTSKVQTLPWMMKPYFSLPTIPIIAGKTRTIYGNTLINVPIVNNLTVEYTCDIGYASGNDYVITPAIANIGNHTLTITFKNKGISIGTFTATLKVSEAKTNVPIKMMQVGDSLVVNGADNIAAKLATELPFSITMVGTQDSAGIKHEGYGGQSFYGFTIQPPFFKNGVIDIPAYFTDNAIAVPDVIHIRVGVNDIFGKCNGEFNEASQNNIIAQSKALIDAFLAYNPNYKIIVALPTITGATSTAWNIDYDENVYFQNKYIEYMHILWGKLVTQYATYNSRVFMSNEVLNLNRTTGYNLTASGGLHPNDTGYALMGEGIADALNEIPFDFAHLTPTGTGAALATMRLTVSSEITITMVGAARFYTDSAGTQGESATWVVTPGALRVMYVKCPTASKMYFSDVTKITGIGDATGSGWVAAAANMPAITIDISRMINLTALKIVCGSTLTRATLTGKLSSVLNRLLLTDVNYTLPSMPLPTGLTSFDLFGNGIYYASSDLLPTGLIQLRIEGSNMNYTGLNFSGTGNLIGLELMNFRTEKLTSAEMVTIINSLINRVGSLPATGKIYDYADYATPPQSVLDAKAALITAKNCTLTFGA